MANSAWTRLAVLALLVERGKAEVVDEGSGGASFGHAYADHNAYRVVVSTKQDLDASNLEPRELAEAMATTWMERAQALGAQPDKQSKPCTSKMKCHTCAAVPGEWCRAVHAGERDAGGWVHPGRDARDEDAIQRGRSAMRAQGTGVFDPGAAAARDIIRQHMLRAGAIELDFDVFDDTVDWKTTPSRTDSWYNSFTDIGSPSTGRYLPISNIAYPQMGRFALRTNQYLAPGTPVAWTADGLAVGLLAKGELHRGHVLVSRPTEDGTGYLIEMDFPG